MSLRLVSLCAAALSVITLAACGGPPPVYDASQHFPLSVTQQRAVAVIDEPAPGRPLSKSGLLSLEQVRHQHLYRGAGPVQISIAAPPGRAARARATAFARQVASALNLPVSDLVVTLVGTKVQRPGAALVQAPIWVAKVPTCGEFKRQPTPDFNNGNMPNFGCSIQRDVGLMLQNPSDLVRMRKDTGADAARAVDVMGKYEKGQTTNSAPEDTSGSSVSSVSK